MGGKRQLHARVLAIAILRLWYCYVSKASSSQGIYRRMRALDSSNACWEKFVAAITLEMKDNTQTTKKPTERPQRLPTTPTGLLCLQTSASGRSALRVCFQFHYNYTPYSNHLSLSSR